MEPRRVVVTGLGGVTPLGPTFSASVQALLEGVSGISEPEVPTLMVQNCRAIARVKSFDPLQHIPPKQLNRLGLFVQYGIGAAEDALQDAGLSLPRDAIVVAGTSRAGVVEMEKVLLNGGRPGPYTMVATMASMLSSAIAERFRTSSEALTLSGACGSGAMAIGYAYRAIQEGRARVALCGGSEAPLTDFSIAGYERMGVLSSLPPDRAERPFDKDRDGFVLAEGASFMVLEELTHALDRGARIYAEVVGYALVVAPESPVAPSLEAEVQVMKRALQEASLVPEEIEHLNLHGTGTLQGDATEAEAVYKVFGEYARKLPVSAVKASTGHMLSGSSAFEAALGVWSINSGIVCPSLRSESPAFDLNLSTRTRKTFIKTALSSSFGFGGVNVALVFRVFEE